MVSAGVAADSRSPLARRSRSGRPRAADGGGRSRTERVSRATSLDASRPIGTRSGNAIGRASHIPDSRLLPRHGGPCGRCREHRGPRPSPCRTTSAFVDIVPRSGSCIRSEQRRLPSRAAPRPRRGARVGCRRGRADRSITGRLFSLAGGPRRDVPRSEPDARSGPGTHPPSLARTADHAKPARSGAARAPSSSIEAFAIRVAVLRVRPFRAPPSLSRKPPGTASRSSSIRTRPLSRLVRRMNAC